MSRHPAIVHWQDIRQPDDACYPGSEEKLSIGSPLGRHFGFARIGIHHELLPPGRRTSWPHAEETEDEFVHVLEGAPDVWLDGVLHRLQAGDSVGFPAGSGIAHTFINNTDRDVRLLCVGDRDRDDNRIHYPQHPARNAAIGARHWRDCPFTPQGEHDGLPDAQREDGKEH
ncbi:cupin domain-containing protein [uncultured Aquitalea sp.]|uniref:cupin domain-containing protein n=1 Tax=uncultured Aquitalea sp. TaxID=540272 RepID=UPI0025FB558B|nr:cupin domain-containing protein [uncultured Aquitalea sp.]